MKNSSIKSEAHPLKQLGDKIATNLQGVNMSIKDFNIESNVSKRLGVKIDWSSGTMSLQGIS